MNKKWKDILLKFEKKTKARAYTNNLKCYGYKTVGIKMNILVKRKDRKKERLVQFGKLVRTPDLSYKTLPIYLKASYESIMVKLKRGWWWDEKYEEITNEEIETGVIPKLISRRRVYIESYKVI